MNKFSVHFFNAHPDDCILGESPEILTKEFSDVDSLIAFLDLAISDYEGWPYAVLEGNDLICFGAFDPSDKQIICDYAGIEYSDCDHFGVRSFVWHMTEENWKNLLHDHSLKTANDRMTKASEDFTAYGSVEYYPYQIDITHLDDPDNWVALLAPYKYVVAECDWTGYGSYEDAPEGYQMWNALDWNDSLGSCPIRCATFESFKKAVEKRFLAYISSHPINSDESLGLTRNIEAPDEETPRTYSLWGRLGMSVRLTEDEHKTISKLLEEGRSEEASAVIFTLFKTRGVFDGDSYVPEECIEEIFGKNSSHYEISFDF